MSQPQPEVSRACLGVIAFLLPPLAVFMVRGCGTSFWINLILFLLFWIFAMIHAMVIVCSDPQPTIITGGAQTYSAPVQTYPAQSYGATGGDTFMGQPVEHAAYPVAAPPPGPPPEQHKY